jgi:hypothetical protein
MRALAVTLALVAAVVTADSRPLPKLPKPAHGFQMRAGEFTVAAGQDREVCEYRRLPNKKAIDVNGFRLSMPPEAHHFVIWSYGGKITDDSRFPDHPVDSVGCAGIAPDDPFPEVLIPIQTPNSRLRFPRGIALTLEPHKQVFLNSHLRNFETETITPDIRFNFYRAPKKSIRHHAEGFIIGNTTGINVPVGGDQTITAEWTAPFNVTLIELATHQHHLGTYANIQFLDANGTPQTVYENGDWQHPPSWWPFPSVRLTQGQKMRITCTWHNTEDHVVHFGPKTTDEMCFILGFYYRDDGDTTPVTGHQCLAAEHGLLCPFAPLVAQ